jgi:hypothetical protein
LPSDAIYFATKWSGTNEIEKCDAIPVKDVIAKIQKKDCSFLELLPWVHESFFDNFDIFDLLIDIQKTKKCIEFGTQYLIELIGSYTNTQIRMDKTLDIINKLDDVNNFEEKYFFIYNLVMLRDERVIPFALSLLPLIKIRHKLKWSGDTTLYLALFQLQNLLNEYFELEIFACQDALKGKD